MKEVSKNILQLPLEQRALMAFQEAVAEVIEEHGRLGLPLYISRGGKVVAITAEEARRGYRAACKKELRKLRRA
jgi:S-adenosylmethionine:tRNA-ribosyltransferase-isomerase (queuine synthetase)